MKTKFLIPALAFVSAIGMSFTTATDDEQSVDWVQRGDIRVSIPEVNCGSGSFNCQVQDGEEGPYLLYDNETDTDPKTGSSTMPIEVDLP